MKKIITITAFLAFVLATCTNISYAQSAQQKSYEIQAAGQESEQSQSATEIRNTNDSVWSNAEQGSGTPDMEHGKTVDIISDNKNEPPQDKPSTFDKPETEEETPWKSTLNTIIAIFALSMVALLAAAKMINDGISNLPSARIGSALAFTAAAALAIALGMAFLIMFSYDQYTLGGIWAGVCVAGIAACLTAGFTGIHQVNQVVMHLKAFIARHFLAIGIAMAAACSAGAGYAIYYSAKVSDEYKQEQQCKNNPSSPDCQKTQETQK